MTILRDFPTSIVRRIKGSRRTARSALLVVVVFALVLAWFAWGRSRAPAADYETQKIALGTVERSITATGAVKALVTVDVGSRLSGIVTDVKATFNDEVKAGQVLAVIDRAPFEAKVLAAKASLAQARAAIGVQEAALEKSRTQSAQSERDVERYRGMVNGEAASQMTLEQAQMQAAVLKEEIAIAQAQLVAAQAVAEQREADLREANIDLQNTQILSPIHGVVIDRKIQPGQTVAASYQTPVLFQIARDLSEIAINAQVDEADIGAVHSGCPARFSVESDPDRSVDGVVEQVRLASVKNGGVVSYTVVVTAQNPGKHLFPDMTATVRIVCDRKDRVLLVPNEALRFRPTDSLAQDGAEASKPLGFEQGALWILSDDGSLRRRQVRLGLKGDTTTEVMGDGIAAGERVVLRAKNAAPAGGH